MRALLPNGASGPAAAIAATFALAIAGCGEKDEPVAPTVDPVAQTETIDELPNLPRGWEPHLNRAAGFALGRPPGWSVRDDGSVTRLTAPDELVVAAISADRTGEALDLEPGEFATATARALSGYKRSPEPSRPRPFDHRYDAAQVKATGVAAKSGVRQDVRVVVIRRDELAVVTGVVAANAERNSGPELRAALAALATVRTRPIG